MFRWRGEGSARRVALHALHHELDAWLLSAQSFRPLAPEARRAFKKHTPAIRRAPVEEWHRA